MARKRHSRKAPRNLLNIVIPVYGRFDLLEKCLESIYNSNTTFDFSISIVDNNSPDQQEADAFYTKHIAEIHNIYRSKVNLGFPRGCNLGAKKPFAPLILFLNSDVILDEYALEIMVREMDNPEIGIVGAKLLFPEDANNFNPNIRPAGKIQHMGLMFAINGTPRHVFVGWDADHPKTQKTIYPDAVTGAALMIRRDLFSSLGGFFEGYGLGTYEDVELCVRAWTKGHKVAVNPKAWGWHYTNASASQYNVSFPLQDNGRLFIQRNAKILRWNEWKVL